MIQEFESVNGMWNCAVREVHKLGSPRESRAGASKEIVGWAGKLVNADANVLVSEVRRMDPAYACAELLWYLSGESSVEMLCRYAPSYKRFANPQESTGHAMGAYGNRIVRQSAFVESKERANKRLARPAHGLEDQIHGVIELMRLEPNTRRALVSLWDGRDLVESIVGEWNDVPCTIALQFIQSNDEKSGDLGPKLDCVTYMRSNDVWLGMPYDVFCFTSIQALIAHRLYLRVGSYTHCVGSLHLYDKDEVKVLDFDESVPRLKPEIGTKTPGRFFNGYDPRGDYGSSREWNVKDALHLEQITADPSLGAVRVFAPGNPIGDAGEVCAARLTNKMNEAAGSGLLVRPSNRVSPALRAAWDLKYVID